MKPGQSGRLVRDSRRRHGSGQSLLYRRLCRELNRLHETGDELEMYAFPWSEDLGGAPGASSIIPDGARQGGTLVYFACRDVPRKPERAAQNGGHHPPPQKCRSANTASSPP